MNKWIDKNVAPEIRNLICIWFVALVIFALVIAFIPDPARGTGFAALFAGVSAVLAAFIAYRGATAKADLDEKIDNRNRLSFFIRSEQTLRIILDQVSFPATDTTRAELVTDQNAFLPIELKKLCLQKPDQLKEIWENLAHFDVDMMTCFRRLIKKMHEYEVEAARIKSFSCPMEHEYNGETGVTISGDSFKKIVALGNKVAVEARTLKTLFSQLIPEQPLDPVRRSRLSLGFKDGVLDSIDSNS